MHTGLAVNVDVPPAFLGFPSDKELGEGGEVGCFAPAQRAAIGHKHVFRTGRVTVLRVAHGKQVGIGAPAIGFYPGVVVHQPPVGQLVDVEVGHLALVGDAQPYPVLAFAAFHLGQLALGGTVFQDDGCQTLHPVELAGQVERVVRILAFQVFVGCLDFFPPEVFRIIVHEIGKSQQAGVKWADDHRGSPVGDGGVGPVLLPRPVGVPQPLELSVFMSLEVIDDINHVVHPQEMAEVAAELVGIGAGAVGQHIAQATGICKVVQAAGQHGAVVLLFAVLPFAVEQHHVVRLALEEIVAVSRVGIPAVAGILENVHPFVERMNELASACEWFHV